MISKVISKIKIGQKKVVIIFDNGDKLEIHPNVFTDFNLFKGKALSKKDIDEIKRRNDLEIYLSYITKLLASKAYSKHQIKTKLLKKGASESQIEDILEILTKYHLIDDKLIIEEVIEYADYRHFGFNKIKEELFKKGISSIYIDKLKYDETREIKHAKSLLKDYERKYDKYNYQMKKRHIYDAYLRQGYSFEVINIVIEDMSPLDEKKEKQLIKGDYQKLIKKYENKLSGNSLKEKVKESLLAKGYRYKDILSIKE